MRRFISSIPHRHQKEHSIKFSWVGAPLFCPEQIEILARRKTDPAKFRKKKKKSLKKAKLLGRVFDTTTLSGLFHIVKLDLLTPHLLLLIIIKYRDCSLAWFALHWALWFRLTFWHSREDLWQKKKHRRETFHKKMFTAKGFQISLFKVGKKCSKNILASPHHQRKDSAHSLLF